MHNSIGPTPHDRIWFLIVPWLTWAIVTKTKRELIICENALLESSLISFVRFNFGNSLVVLCPLWLKRLYFWKTHLLGFTWFEDCIILKLCGLYNNGFFTIHLFYTFYKIWVVNYLKLLIIFKMWTVTAQRFANVILMQFVASISNYLFFHPYMTQLANIICYLICSHTQYFVFPTFADLEGWG